jgi:hypothetical protein
MNFYIALIHYPIINKNKEIIVTSIVVHDIHDISRAAKTFGVKKFFVVEPFEGERKIVERIEHFWQTSGKEYNSNRLEAISILSLKERFEDVLDEVTQETGRTPVVIGTSAQKKDFEEISFKEVAELLKRDEVVLILFGTGWGIAYKELGKVDYFLPPIEGIGDFNHLSVRSAASIVLDRIISQFKTL